ncbi:DNA replication/repair protein RecF [Eisenibacter elegans]|jgi:DNA replication and repair protein RecF|uniref:DNA replication/repair protein RecF n=1 Tax=Eisenibacter elegans TaxID=997 RepID=UPI00047ABEE4|nr:DNA replication and repair protein RecF [Eisenibacter elegans]
MNLKQISVFNFKNYASLALVFSADINCLVGENGSGKTNLLDAIHYLTLTKSAFNAIDGQNIRHEEEFFVVKGIFEQPQARPTEVACSVQQGQKKTFLANQKPYERISEHIGRFPVVMIAPQDMALIQEGSEQRRSFFDNMLCQIDAEYLARLMRYNYALRQRNALLKQIAEQPRADLTLIEVYDQTILQEGAILYAQRAAFVAEFVPIFATHYQTLSLGKEDVKIDYRSDFAAQDYEAQYHKALLKDRVLQRTTQGIHKDEYQLLMDGYALKKFGSQGQQKSFLIALKLAQFDCMAAAKGQKPLLLLDDIFDKLDDHRMQQLIALVAGGHFGQIFITDARPERTRTLLQTVAAEKRLFTLQKGALTGQEIL